MCFLEFMDVVKFFSRAFIIDASAYETAEYTSGYVRLLNTLRPNSIFYYFNAPLTQLCV